jgi:hypothetical protein
MFTIRQFLPVALAVGYVAAQKCNLQFDGRVPKDFAPTEFDDDNGIFDPEFVKGKGEDDLCTFTTPTSYSVVDS